MQVFIENIYLYVSEMSYKRNEFQLVYLKQMLTRTNKVKAPDALNDETYRLNMRKNSEGDVVTLNISYEFTSRIYFNELRKKALMR